MHLSEAADIKIGGHEAQAVLLGDAIQWGEYRHPVADFADGYPSALPASTNFVVESPGPFDGTPALRSTPAASHRMLTFKDLYLLPYTGPGRRVIELRVRLDGPTTPASPILGGIALWDETGGSNAGFQACIDNRTATSGSTAPMQVRRDAATNVLVASGAGPGVIELGRNYRLQYEYNRASPNHILRLYNDAGALLGTIQGDSGLYRTVPLRLGFYAYNEVAFDDLGIRYGA